MEFGNDGRVKGLLNFNVNREAGNHLCYTCMHTHCHNTSAVINVVYSTDIQSTEPWTNLGTLQDPKLQKLANSLMGTILKSRADSTTKKYLYAIERWRQWAFSKEEITEFPVLDYQFALYLQDIGETTGSKSAVEEAVNAMSWMQQLAGQIGVSQSPIVKAAVAGLQRQLAKPKLKKEPVTLEMLEKMAESAGCPPTLTESRLLAMSLLAFAAFLRCDEMIKLRCCDVKLHEEHIVLSIRSSKTDQFREGADIVVARTGTMTCPGAALEQYIRLASIDLESSERLFRAIVKTKKGEKLRRGGTISYTRIRELILKKISSLGYDASLFGVHSFRAGGATLAANAGVPERMFKRHGRWRSENAKDGIH